MNLEDQWTFLDDVRRAVPDKFTPVWKNIRMTLSDAEQEALEDWLNG